jgi:hypothetical protein
MKDYQERRRSSGVLLTGPNGVGKSAVGLHSFLCCQALGHFAVYIPDSKPWVAEARHGRGDEYLLEQFFLQNVHGIACTPSLHSIFRDRFRGVPVNVSMMHQLRYLLAQFTAPRIAVAVIGDEMQNGTNAAALMNLAAVPPVEASYFHEGWSSWVTSNSCFVRMDIASSHGLRELNLSVGNFDRLRFVRPWPLEIARLALTHSQSPAFVERTKAHDRIIHIAGGVIRKLMLCHKMLPDGAVTKASLLQMELGMRGAMKSDCVHWLKKLLSEAERREVARKIMPLLQGNVSWDMAKGAYDHGLVALTSSDVFVQPISPVAGSVLHQQLLTVLRGMERVSLSSIDQGPQRGYELERQMQMRLVPCAKSIGTKHLQIADGPGSAAHLRVDHMLLFHEPKDTVLSESLSTLYVPDRSNYACDGIIVPAVRTSNVDGAESEASASAVERALDPVLVLEHSVTDPRDSERVEKIEKWFSPGALIDKVKAAHPGRPITILLCWPALLEKSDHTKHAQLDVLAKTASVELFVVDSDGLSMLGINI